MKYRRRGLYVEATENKETGLMDVVIDGETVSMKREQFEGTYIPDEHEKKHEKKHD